MTRSKAIALFLLSVIGITQAFAPPAASPRYRYHHGLSRLSMVRDDNPSVTSRRAALSSFVTSAAALLASTAAPPQASAAESRTIAQISGSGLVFKDTLVVESFDDPKVKGVTLYVSNFERPLTERLQKDFFTEPSYASVTCVRNGKEIEVADNIDKSDKGEVSWNFRESCTISVTIMWLLDSFLATFSLTMYVFPCQRKQLNNWQSPYLKKSDPCCSKNYESKESMMSKRIPSCTFHSTLD
ncbi:hypothetical protein HJC23_006424 [Cyclotella cryptica]|uniref:Photosystem II reaction center Psb28 protein n=1 Tax=Cyclotella cryptica TaxID=29204 RepID=A0ABD3QUA0_9STRA